MTPPAPRLPEVCLPSQIGPFVDFLRSLPPDHTFDHDACGCPVAGFLRHLGATDPSVCSAFYSCSDREKYKKTPTWVNRFVNTYDKLNESGRSDTRHEASTALRIALALTLAKETTNAD